MPSTTPSALPSAETISLPSATIAELWASRAATDPDHVYCTFEGDDWTIERMHSYSNRIANGLLGICQPGDHVALMLQNDPDHVATIFGLAKAGLCRIPVNINLKGIALTFIFEKFSPTLLIADISFRDVLEPAMAEHSNVQVVWRDTANPETCGLRRLSETSDKAPPPVVKGDDIIAITPSSGTTGEPKGVLKTDLSLRTGPVGIFALTSADRGDVLLHWEPLYHGAGVAVLIAAVMRPLKLVMVRRFSASRFWSQVRDEKITLIHYLGGILQILLAQPETPEEKQHNLRLAWGGGCSKAVADRFTQRFGIAMREGYGLSEMTTFVTVSDAETPSGSCGKALPFYETRLRAVDDTGDANFGELLARPTAPGLAFRGYYGRPGSVEEQVVDGWFSTGDLMRRDSNGNYTYAGRLKDSVRRRGVNISAWEVERVFQSDPDVEECALIGVEGEFGDDDLKIFVKLSRGAAENAEGLMTRVSANLPYFQIPKYLAFIEEFEKTPTQRIIKANLSRSVEGCFDFENEVGRIGARLGKGELTRS